MLFSHPADYTPVCTTELGAVAKLIPEFERRDVKVVALSCDSVESHKGWVNDIQARPVIVCGMWYSAECEMSSECSFGML